MLTVALSHPPSFLTTATTHVDLFNLSQVAAVITLNDGTAFLANFEEWPVGMRATRAAVPTYADITIYHAQNRLFFSGSKEIRLDDTCLPSHLDAFDDGLEKGGR